MPSDLEDAIAIQREALKLTPAGHPNRNVSLISLASALKVCFDQSQRPEDLDECMQLWESAANDHLASLFDRLKAAVRWARTARSSNHTTTLEAYDVALSLLQRTLTTRPTFEMQHELLTGEENYLSLALDAASYTVEKDDTKKAIETIEQGRGMLWSQLRSFRAPLEKLAEVNKPLADRFRDVGMQLETLSTVTVSSEERNLASFFNGSIADVRADQRIFDEMLIQKGKLLEEQERIVVEIRKEVGFKDFLKAALFETLREASVEGPVIIVNTCKYRSDAIIVLHHHPPATVPLDSDFHTDATKLCNELLQTRRAYKATSSEYDSILRQIMQMLWDRVVSHVIQKLEEFGIVEGSRIWWCPTSILSAFPFHAAGPYKNSHGSDKYLVDDFASSYIPSLTSLINARSSTLKKSFKLLVVGDNNLPSAKREIEIIHKYKSSSKILVGDEASSETVLDNLQAHSWAHFVCHAHLDPKPFASSFRLPGSGLTLLDIMRSRLPNAEFAFLSACHTAELAPQCAQDEALHLAAAMQSCGFRSVIGTMWELNDTDGPFFTREVYSQMMGKLKGEEVKCKRAAEALRCAAVELKSLKNIKAERWVNLIHIGI